MKLNVPYYSQRIDVLDPEWKWRSCGICALKMAMEFLENAADSSLRRPTSKLVNPDDLIKEGLKINAYLKNVGWIHQGLIDLGKKYGFLNSFRKEWPEDKKNEAIKYLIEFLEKEIPILASVKNASGGGHLVLIVGSEGSEEASEGFYVHDPDAHNAEEGKFKFLNLSKFLKIWKGRIIVLRKTA